MEFLGDEAHAKTKLRYPELLNIWKDDCLELNAYGITPKKRREKQNTEIHISQRAVDARTSSHAQVPTQIPIQHSRAPLNPPAIAVVAMTI